MKTSACICSLISTLAMMASSAALADKPLRMDLRPFVQPHASVAPSPSPAGRRANSFLTPRPGRITAKPMPHEPRVDALGLGVGLVTGLEADELTVANSPANGYPTLQFQKRGHLARDIKRGYRNMEANLARKVWDDPKGKRIVLDIEGHPGLGVEIPLR